MPSSLTRRKFIGTGISAAALIAAGVQDAQAYSVGTPLGFQLHSLRAQAVTDLAGTLKKMAAIGYKQVEMLSFKGYSGPPTKDGFGPLAGLSVNDTNKMIQDANLICLGCHFKYEEFEDTRIQDSFDWAHGLGARYMIASDITPADTLDDWKKNFAKLNRYGEAVRKAGFQMAHHTAPADWKEFDGVKAMDLFLQNVDAKHCQIELDLESTVTMKVDGADYMLKHPRRFFALHLRDEKTPEKLGTYLNALPLGEGEIDWKKMFTAAKKAGVKYYYVEMETRGMTDPIAIYKTCYDYIQSLKV